MQGKHRNMTKKHHQTTKTYEVWIMVFLYSMSIQFIKMYSMLMGVCFDSRVLKIHIVILKNEHQIKFRAKSSLKTLLET